VAQFPPQPGEELAQVALVCRERVLGGAALVRQMDQPGLCGAARILGKRQLAVVENSLERRHGGLFRPANAHIRYSNVL
jgi:hypothetical protein